MGGLISGATVGRAGGGVGIASGTVDTSSSVSGGAAGYVPRDKYGPL
jgi:hypothetical protein